MKNTIFVLGLFLSIGLAVRPISAQEEVKNPLRLPVQAFEPLPGKVIGVLVSGSRPLLASEHRKGPADALTLGTGDGSPYWLYLPDQKKPMIGAMLFAVGEKGEQKQRFNRLSLATLKSTGFARPYTLVEIEVNAGLGCPATDAFVATAIHSVEGSQRYPLHVADVVERLEEHFQNWKSTKASTLNATLAELRKTLGWSSKEKTTRVEEQLVYVTWLREREILQVQFRVRREEKDPLFVPSKPPIAYEGEDGAPPDKKATRVVGVELGMGYEVSREGKLLRLEETPRREFHHSDRSFENGTRFSDQ
jgi:hypothetical protein